MRSDTLPDSELVATAWQPGLAKSFDAATFAGDASFAPGDGVRSTISGAPIELHQTAPGRSVSREAAMSLTQQRSISRSVLARAPLTLAQSASRLAAATDRPAFREEPERPAAESFAPATMTLARSATANAMQAMTQLAAVSPVVQREEAPAPPPAEASTAGAIPDTAQTAEKVFAILERRLMVERERSGFRRM
jgi:hypothetical protein